MLSSRCLPAPLGLLAGLLLVSSPLRAEVEEISVGVNGVTCPVCTHSLNIGVRRLAGVKSVKVSLATRVRLEVSVYPGAWIDPAQIFQQIRVLGYTPREDEVKLRLVGDVTMSGAQMLFTVSDAAPGPVRFVLVSPESGSKQSEAIRQLMDHLAKSLDAGGRNSQHIEVEGWWRPAQGPLIPASLVLTAMKDAG